MYYLVIQNNYTEVQLALMAGKEVVASSSINKIEASKELIIRIDKLLHEACISLSNISFITANTGPGPFTTLRVVITTVNGLAYATQIPLIGVNALYAAAQEWDDPAYATTALFFNAFGHDVYALVIHNNKKLFYGVYPINTILQELKKRETLIRFLGNGVTLHQDLIRQTVAEKAFIPENNPAYCSLEQIARMGWQQWKEGTRGEDELLPVYLKQHPAAL